MNFPFSNWVLKWHRPFNITGKSLATKYLSSDFAAVNKYLLSINTYSSSFAAVNVISKGSPCESASVCGFFFFFSQCYAADRNFCKIHHDVAPGGLECWVSSRACRRQHFGVTPAGLGCCVAARICLRFHFGVCLAWVLIKRIGWQKETESSSHIFW